MIATINALGWLLGTLVGWGLVFLVLGAVWAASRTQWKRPAPVKRWEDQVDLTLNQRTCWRCGAERVSVNKEDNPVLTYDCGTKVYIDMDIERIVNILGKDCHRKDTP